MRREQRYSSPDRSTGGGSRPGNTDRVLHREKRRIPMFSLSGLFLKLALHICYVRCFTCTFSLIHGNCRNFTQKPITRFLLPHVCSRELVARSTLCAVGFSKRGGEAHIRPAVAMHVCIMYSSPSPSLDCRPRFPPTSCRGQAVTSLRAVRRDLGSRTKFRTGFSAPNPPKNLAARLAFATVAWALGVLLTDLNMGYNEKM